MFCSKCGNEIPDEGAFCPKCGSPVKKPKPAEGDKPAETLAEEGQPVKAPAEETREENGNQAIEASGVDGIGAGKAVEKPKRKKKGIVIAVACLVVVVGVGVGVWWHFAHAVHTVAVSVGAPDWDGDSTSIPVEISGVDAGGGSVSQVQFMEPDSPSVELTPGAYDVTFKSGYVTGEAHVAVPKEKTVHVEIGLFDESQCDLGEAVSYTILDDDAVSDERFSLIIECAGQNPDDDGKAERLCKKAQEHGAFMKEAKANAEGFLRCVFDSKHNSEKGRSVSQFVTKGKYIQTGSGITTIASITLTMDSDDKVGYQLHYTYQGPYNTTGAEDASGYLGIASNGKVDSWYAEGSTRNALYG